MVVVQYCSSHAVVVVAVHSGSDRGSGIYGYI